MNYLEAQEFFKSTYPGKQISFDFDDKCIRQVESLYTEGKLHTYNHVEYRKVKVTVEGIPTVYVPIQPHRMIISASQIKAKVPNDDVYIHPDELKNINDLINKQHPGLDELLSLMTIHTGLSKQEILNRANKIKN